MLCYDILTDIECLKNFKKNIPFKKNQKIFKNLKIKEFHPCFLNKIIKYPKKKSRAFYPMYLPFIWQFNFRLLRDLHQIKTKLHIFSLSILL